MYRQRAVLAQRGQVLRVFLLQGALVSVLGSALGLVLKGRLTIQLRAGDVTLGPGELFVVPRGVEHCPVAEEETHVLLIEPRGTSNTGDAATAAARVVV